MRFNTQNIKELLAKGANLIIDDSMPVEELRYLAQTAREKKKNLTIVVKKWKLEDLKRIAGDGNGFLTIDIRE